MPKVLNDCFYPNLFFLTEIYAFLLVILFLKASHNMKSLKTEMLLNSCMFMTKIERKSGKIFYILLKLFEYSAEKISTKSTYKNGVY